MRRVGLTTTDHGMKRRVEDTTGESTGTTSGFAGSGICSPGRNAELGGGEVRYRHRGAGRLVEGCLSTLLPRHNEARERARQSDGAAHCRPAK